MQAVAPFAVLMPGRLLFGRGQAAAAAPAIAGLGRRVALVHGADPDRAAWLLRALAAEGCAVTAIACPGEPDLPMLEAAVEAARGAEVVVGLGGGAALDLAKAVAALLPAPGGAMDHLEVVGRGLPLAADPLPFVAVPTTSGTGAEATKNAVIGVPEHGRKVSLRDDRMLARLALVDPALTDFCPRAVTLASGLDALTQVIEPWLCTRANPFTDALCRPAIPLALAALRRLMAGEEAGARDAMAWVSHCGGVALANAGLGAVHGLAGVIGGLTGAPHGAVCGALLPAALAVNARAVPPGSPAAARIAEVLALLAGAFGARDGAAALAGWAAAEGLPPLSALGLAPDRHRAVAEAARHSSSMKANPAPLSTGALVEILDRAG